MNRLKVKIRFYHGDITQVPNRDYDAYDGEYRIRSRTVELILNTESENRKLCKKRQQKIPSIYTYNQR